MIGALSVSLGATGCGSDGDPKGDDTTKDDTDDATEDDTGDDDDATDDDTGDDTTDDDTDDGSGGDAGSPMVDDDQPDDEVSTDAGTPDAGTEQSDSLTLKRRVLVAADGAEQYVGPGYEEPGQGCTFAAPASPEAGYVCRPNTDGVVVYADPACQSPLLRTRSCPAAGQVVSGPDGVLQVSAETTAEVYYRLRGDACEEQTIGDFNFYELTPSELQFAEGTLETDAPAADGLQLSFIASGGSRFPEQRAFADGVCSPQKTPGADGDIYCVPDASRYAEREHYTDAACTDEFATFYPDLFPGVGEPSYKADILPDPNHPDGCWGLLAVHALGPGTDSVGDHYFGQSCELQSAQAGEKAYPVLQSVPLSTFPQLQVMEVGSGRLVHRALVDAQGNVVGSDGWYDKQLQVACQPYRFSDGSLRCSPTTQGGGGQYYSDANCTEPLWSEGRCEVLYEKLYRVRLGNPPTVCGGSAVIEVQEAVKYTGAVYTDNGGCVATTPQTEVWQPGPMVDLSTFEEMHYEFR